MTDLLLPTFEGRLKCQRKAQYAAFLTDIVRAASDGIEALSTFRTILYDDQNVSGQGSFMSFDAHVGDTGCHLRAGMFYETYIIHRAMAKHPLTGEIFAPNWINRTIHHLELTRKKAQNMCLALTRDGARPKTIGLSGKELLITKGLRALEWEDLPIMKNLYPLYDSQQSFEEQMDRLSFAEAPTVPSESLDPSRPSTPSFVESEGPSPFKAQWDLHDTGILVRLVVYCFVLSKYKTFSSMNNTIAARTTPEAAAEQGYSLMEKFWDFSNPEYKKPRLDRIIQELRVLQGWVSDLSCSWLHSIATRCDLKDMANLIAETARKSGTGLTVAPCYPGYLLLRREWVHGETQILLVDRYFCSHGWHFNIFVAHIGLKRDGQVFDADLQAPVEWYIQPIPLSKLLVASEWSARPLPVGMGNSISGSSDQYRDRILSKEMSGYHRCGAGDCVENNQHLRDFEEADHDRLALAFFGSHKSYPFHVETAGEMDFVGLYMDIFCPGMRKQWETVAGELGHQGGGQENQDIFGWQHIFIESPQIVAQKLKQWMSDGNLLPLYA